MTSLARFAIENHSMIIALLQLHVLRFPVECKSTQVSTQSFHVKTLTFSMAVRMYAMETKRTKTRLGTLVAHLGLVVLSVIVDICVFLHNTNIKHGVLS